MNKKFKSVLFYICLLLIMCLTGCSKNNKKIENEELKNDINKKYENRWAIDLPENFVG